MLHIDSSPGCASAPCGVHRRNLGISGRCDGREISNGAGALCRPSCFLKVGCCFHDVFFLESHQLTPTTPIRIYGGTPWQDSPRESSRRSTCVLCSRSRHQSPPSPRNAWHRSTNCHPPTWRNTYRPFQRLASQKRCLAELADTVSRETRDRSLSWTLSTQSSLTNRGFVAPRFANAVRPHSRQACTHRHAILPPRYGRLSEPGRITLTR